MSTHTTASQFRRSRGTVRSRIMTSSTGIPYVKVIEQHRDEEQLEQYRKEQETDVHQISIQELCERFGTDAEQGLSRQKADELLVLNGPNCLTPPMQTSTFRLLVHNLFGGFAMLIWAAILLILLLVIINVIHGTVDDEMWSHIYMAVILFIIVNCTGIFSFYHEDKSKKIMDYFQKMMAAQSFVIRSGVLKTIPTDEIVVGDLVYVSIGSKVPADIRLTTSDGLKVDNSYLTGESKAQVRSVNCTSESLIETENIIFGSTGVVEGSGKGIVFCTGDLTYMGKIAGLTSCMVAEPTPIRKEIDRFVFVISIVALAISVFIFILFISVGGNVFKGFLFFVGLVVANIPEGLLVTMTACLTLTAKELARKFCLCKTLDSIETLGSTSIILSDKTGTLTQNKMTVVHVWFNNVVLTADTSGITGVDIGFDTSNIDFLTLANTASLCSVAEFLPNQEEIPILQREVLGDASESAILKFITRCLGEGFVENIRLENPQVFAIPFNSLNKYALSIHYLEDDNIYLIAVKGAPEVVLNFCSTIQLAGIDVPLVDAENNIDNEQILKKAIGEFGLCGERVIAFANYKLPVDKFPPNNFVFNRDNYPKTNYKFCGLVSMMDPPRPNVLDAVKRCRSAGIRVIMVTGDHPVTAGAIAKKTGIISPTSATVYDTASKPTHSEVRNEDEQYTAAVITGSEIREMSTIQLVNAFKEYNELVFARTSPQQKLQIVEAAQLTGAIVAVTGDGVNDAPAMKRADIGIAMGITGTEVAKEAANMVLLDDNFASIINGIEQGRLVFDNFKKSIFFILTSNMPELTPCVFHVILNIPMPLSIISIICIDFITDLWPGISLAYEKSERDIMHLPPRDPKVDRLINGRMIFMTYAQIGIVQSFAGFTNYLLAYANNGFMPSDLVGLRERWHSPSFQNVTDQHGNKWTFKDRQKMTAYGITAYYIAILITQMADLIICRTRRNSLFTHGIWSNWALIIGIVVELLISILLIYTPGLLKVFNFYPVSWKFWVIPIPFAIFIIVFDELRKLFIRKYPGGFFERYTAY